MAKSARVLIDSWAPNDLQIGQNTHQHSFALLCGHLSSLGPCIPCPALLSSAASSCGLLTGVVDLVRGAPGCSSGATGGGECECDTQFDEPLQKDFALIPGLSAGWA